jgi:hypothetical protein
MNGILVRPSRKSQDRARPSEHEASARIDDVMAVRNFEVS